MLPGDLRLFPIGVRHPIKCFRVSASVFEIHRCEPARFTKLKQGALQQFRRINLPGRSQITAEDEFDVREVEMIIGIVTFGANRQEKLLRCFADAADPEIGDAQRVRRFPILRLEPLRCPPMFDCCFRLPVFPEKCGKGVLRRDRLRIVSDELVVDLLHTQTLFYRYVGIRERRRCLMGRFDFYPRFYRRTDEFRTREQKRKEQNEERGGSPLAFTPVAPARAVADYHSCRSSWRDHLHMQKIGFAEALDSNCRHRQPLVTGGLRLVFLRDVLYYTTKQQKKTKGTAGQPGSPKANSGAALRPFFPSAPFLPWT